MICSMTSDHALSAITKTDVTGMNFVLAANKTYVGEFVLRTSANATTVGCQFDLTFGGTVTRFDGNLEYWNALTTKDTLIVTNDTATPFPFPTLTSQGNVIFVYRLTFRIEVGASGGTLQLQHGSETATLTTVHEGSYGSCVEG